MRQKTVKIKLFAQMTIGVTRISDSSRCPHNTSGHRDDIPPTESQPVDRDVMRGRDDLRVVRILTLRADELDVGVSDETIKCTLLKDHCRAPLETHQKSFD